MLSKLNRSNYFIQLLMFFLILIFIFGRAFIGISIFGFRIGELIVAFSLLLTLGAFLDSQFLGLEYFLMEQEMLILKGSSFITV